MTQKNDFFSLSVLFNDYLLYKSLPEFTLVFLENNPKFPVNPILLLKLFYLADPKFAIPLMVEVAPPPKLPNSLIN